MCVTHLAGEAQDGKARACGGVQPDLANAACTTPSSAQNWFRHSSSEPCKIRTAQNWGQLWPYKTALTALAQTSTRVGANLDARTAEPHANPDAHGGHRPVARDPPARRRAHK